MKILRGGAPKREALKKSGGGEVAPKICILLNQQNGGGLLKN